MTTESRHQWTPVPDRLRRRFTVRAPNRCWVADLTYLDTVEGWQYLAVVIDLFSRRVVGGACRPTRQSDLATAALHSPLGYQAPAAFEAAGVM